MTVANGGIVVYTDSDGLNPSSVPTVNSYYKVHIFNSSADLEVSEAGNLDCLIVAGGGSGGGKTSTASDGSGGGGAGGVLYVTSYLVPLGTYSVVVGAGGKGGGGGIPGNNGENSVFYDLTAIGGGKGAEGSPTDGDGYAGGSGGGGASLYAVHLGGVGVSGQGHDGENAGFPKSNGGGGGGAGQVGGTNQNGYGGDGLPFSISGIETYYGGGGGALDTSGSPGLGGLGGGGDCGARGEAGASGTPNTGGGGGGGQYVSPFQYFDGGDGGSGIVIVRYLYQGEIVYTDVDGLNPTTAPDENTIYKVHIFKSSGNLVLSEEKSVDYLIVGGGGAGGVYGGGGAGGFLTGSTVVTIGTKTVIVGDGGTPVGSGDPTTTLPSVGNGGDSTFDGLLAHGGGGGGNADNVAEMYAIGANGGSGGGGGSNVNTDHTHHSGGSGVVGQGYAGGQCEGKSGSQCGGGGGAGGVGADSFGIFCGNGGTGLPSSISGEEVYYAGGGGGGCYFGRLSTGGNGGGGAGGVAAAVLYDPVTLAEVGEPNTGGGGGGGYTQIVPSYVSGTAGGSGIVIVRYLYGSVPTVTVTTLACDAFASSFKANASISPSTYAVDLVGFAYYNVSNPSSIINSSTSGDYTGTSSFSKTIAVEPNSSYMVRAFARYNGVTYYGEYVSASTIVISEIEVTPVLPELQIGETVQLTVTATYTNGATADLTSSAGYSSQDLVVFVPVYGEDNSFDIYSSTGDTIATVSSGGLVTGISGGVAKIYIYVSGFKDTVSLTVVQPAEGTVDVGGIWDGGLAPGAIIPNVIGVELIIDSSMYVTSSQQALLYGEYDDSPSTTSLLNNADAVWSSSDTTVATIDANGLIVAIAVGVTFIKVSYTTEDSPEITYTSMAMLRVESQEGLVVEGQPYQYIPLSPDPNQSFRLTVAASEDKSVELDFNLRWNGETECWYMTLSDPVEQEYYVDDIPLLAGEQSMKNILKLYSYLDIGSCFIIDISGKGTGKPDLYNLGIDFVMIWGYTE